MDQRTIVNVRGFDMNDLVGSVWKQESTESVVRITSVSVGPLSVIRGYTYVKIIHLKGNIDFGEELISVLPKKNFVIWIREMSENKMGVRTLAMLPELQRR
jgi:hypothetical protein